MSQRSTNPILHSWIAPPRPPQPRQPGAAMTKLRLHGEITVQGAIPLFEAIRAASENSIEIEIDSGGGNALCALGLYELLILHPHSVVATIVGRASSGAAIVAMGADRRRIAEAASVMLHPATGPDEWRGHVDEIVAEIVSAATEQPRFVVDAWLAGETRFTADEAGAAGLMDEVIP